jgi:hypothetical protein
MIMHPDALPRQSSFVLVGNRKGQTTQSADGQEAFAVRFLRRGSPDRLDPERFSTFELLG